MKLNKRVIFDKATIVFVDDNDLYYENAYRCCFNFHNYGIMIESGVGIDGTVAFWVEGDDYYPIIRDVTGELETIWDEFELDEYVNVGIVSEEELDRMVRLRDLLNERYLEDGV